MNHKPNNSKRNVFELVTLKEWQGARLTRLSSRQKRRLKSKKMERIQ